MNEEEVRVKFMKYEQTILESELMTRNEIDIDFNGEMMVKFERFDDDWVAVNGMNGWGENIAQDVLGIKLLVIPHE